MRRMSLVGDAVSHAVLPGAAIGYMFAGLSLPAMSVGGFGNGLLMALLAGLVSRFTSLKEDRELCRILFGQPCHRRGFGQQKRQQRRFAAFAVWLGVGGGYSGFAADCRFCERHYFADGCDVPPAGVGKHRPLCSSRLSAVRAAFGMCCFWCWS